MASFGRTSEGTLGQTIQVTADGKPDVKAGGVTIDWATVTAVTADVTVEEAVTVLSGTKYLRYGQVVCLITASGKYGPYDPAASDGREIAPIRGKSWILNKTVLQADDMSDHPNAIYGGKVFYSRLIQSVAVAHSLILGPTLAELLAAFPKLDLVYD